MGLSFLEKSILVAEERSNRRGMGPLTGGSGAAAEGSPSGWQSVGWSCNGFRAAGMSLLFFRNIPRL